MANQSVYLDYAAATPLDAEVFTAMQPYFTDKFYNPSATYLAAKGVKDDLHQSRAKIAQIVGAKPSEIIFTAGGTEANNLAIKGVLEQFPGSKVLVSAVEHESVLQPAALFSHELIPVDAKGMVDLAQFEQQVTDDTVLISVMYANNEVGTVQPLRRVVQIAEKIRTVRRAAGNTLPLYVHTDACQAGNYLDLHISRLGLDLMTLNGGKIYGPKQSGVLYAASHVRLQPQIIGGGQERNLRSGTENVAFAAGMAAALEAVQQIRHEEVKRMQDLQRHFIKKLEEAIPQAIINGSTKHRLPNNVHLTIPGQDNERLIFALDEHSIQAAAGSACSASNEEPSHVLQAMGISDVNAQASLRLSMGRQTTQADIDYAVKTLASLL